MASNYNNVYLFGYKASTWNDTKNEPNPLNIYLVDTTTGALTLIAAPALDEDFRHMNGRVDHIEPECRCALRRGECLRKRRRPRGLQLRESIR